MFIYPLEKVELPNKFIVIKNNQKTIEDILNDFCREANIINNKYAGKMLMNALRYFLVHTENIEKMYSNYYSKEYSNLDEYLFKKMLLSGGDIAFLSNKINKGESIFYSDLTNCRFSKYNDLIMHEGDRFYDKLNKVLEMI